jgi:hypothetical protein
MAHDHDGDHQTSPGHPAVANPPAGAEEPVRTLSPAAQRALAEAEERRRAAAAAAAALAERPKELGGRAGPDPVRYGDWEKGGIASDF